MKLGLNTYSLSATGWSPLQCLDFCDRHQIRVVQFLGLAQLRKMPEGLLKEISQHAKNLGIQLQLHGQSLSPHSSIGKLQPGETIFTRVSDAIRIAGIFNAKILNCTLGRIEDRSPPGSIILRIQEVIESAKSLRPVLKEHGMKIALENHVGDLLGEEIRKIIEEVGDDCMGCSIDTGNSISGLEHPLTTLNHLKSHVLTSHIRDTMIWKHPQGIMIKWLPLGEGNIGIEEWARAFMETCPHIPFILEMVPGVQPVLIPYLEPDFWKIFPDKKASELAVLERIIRTAPPFENADLASLENPSLSKSELQIAALEKSIVFCREKLKLE